MRSPMQLNYTAPENVRASIAALGRTEDVKFSPDNNRLAVASFLRNQIAIFEIRLDDSPNGKQVSLRDVTVISSAYLSQPHGIDFIDNGTIIVANRTGDARIFELPSNGGDYDLVPLEIIRSGEVVDGPGAVTIARREGGCCEALICNNFSNKVTKHLIDLTGNWPVDSSQILLRKWLNWPDGVSVSDPWIAISNHHSHNVFLYDSGTSLNEYSEPDGILRCAHFPHGLRFTPDDRFILVADSGAPYVHIYARDESGWRGVRSPFKSVRVLSDEDFLRGHMCGPKGLDIDGSMSTLVTTCKVQPLAFFPLAEILEWISLLQENGGKGTASLGEELHASYETHGQAQGALEIKYELKRHEVAYQLRQALAAVTNSQSWRYTAPLRGMYSFLRRCYPSTRDRG